MGFFVEGVAVGQGGGGVVEAGRVGCEGVIGIMLCMGVVG